MDYVNAYAVGPNGQKQERVYYFDLAYDNLDGTALAHYNTSFDSLVVDTNDSNGNAMNWFFDPTPFDNSEFNVQQSLVRDLDPQAVDNAFGGQTINLLEAGY